MIIVNLDVELAKKKMRSGELAERIGITPANLSVLKTGKAKAIRFTTLDAICKELNLDQTKKTKSLKQFSHLSRDDASSFFYFFFSHATRARLASTVPQTMAICVFETVSS